MKLSMIGLAVLSLAVTTSIAPAVTIVIDYRYDTSNFFADPTRRAVLEAAAARWSAILDDGNLAAYNLDNANQGRIGFSNPTTGLDIEVSSATSTATDTLFGFVGAADEYRDLSAGVDQYTLYAGARNLGTTAGVGGTGTGTNFTTAFTDPNSHINRGFNGLTPPSTPTSLPVWGGSIAFNSTTAWALNGDLYSVALHEIGHSLGLASNWDNFTNNIDINGDYIGTNALTAVNTDNSSSLTSLSLVGGGDNHFANNAHQSEIFAAGDPDYTGTVGAGNLQQLLLDPIAEFPAGVTRFELTNADVGSAQDVGWSVIPSLTVAIPEPFVLSGLSIAGILFCFARNRRIFK